MLCLYYIILRELRKPHYNGIAQSKIIFPEPEVFCWRVIARVVFFCIFIIVIKQEEVIIIIYGDALTDVLLRYKGSDSGNNIAILESSLYGSEVPLLLGF